MTNAQENELKQKAQNTNEAIFGDLGLAIPFAERRKTETLIYNLLSASDYQLHQVAHHLIAKLEKQLHETELSIQKIETEKKQVSYAFFYKEFLLKKQIEHVQRYKTAIEKQLSTWQIVSEQAIGLYNATFSLIGSWFGYKPKEDITEKITNQIVSYITFERENILFNYEKLLTLLAVRKINTLPKLIDFWDTPQVQQELKIRAKQVGPKVKVQFWAAAASMAADFALQGLVMAGGELAMQWVDEADQLIYKIIQKRQQKITDDFKIFRKQVDTDQKTMRTNISTAFAASQKLLNQEFVQTNAQLREEIVYLNQAINLDIPIKHYLQAWRSWDQYFQTSPMFTPKTMYSWYNIFNIYTHGDWEFDATTNSFWQNGLVEFPKPLLWQKKEKKDIFTDDPAAESIFTEYITDKLSYDIEVECTLLTCTYPFVVGLTFNRGRWISGDPERVWWYRLLGLYGQEGTPGDATTRNINLSFAQQKLELPGGQREKEVITSPLEQIMKDKTTPINYKLDAKAVTDLVKNPITFVFKITNQPSTVTIELDQKEKDATGKETIKQLYSGSVSNLERYIYQYHGIGFMAAGCQATFKITKPEGLVYTSQEIGEFKKQIAAQMKSTS